MPCTLTTISGISLAKYLIKKKIPVTCWDDNPEKRKVSLSLRIKINNLTPETLKNCNYLVLSPGINHQKKRPHQAVKIARSLDIKIVTDLEFLKILSNSGMRVHEALLLRWSDIKLQKKVEIETIKDKDGN